MSYKKAWRAKEYAVASVVEMLEESDAKLPLWYVLLESNNLDSLTHIKANLDNRFQFYFMVIGACIQESKYSSYGGY